MMIQKIRDNAAWVVLVAVVCFVALIFVDWGMSPGNSMTQKTIVGEVDGESIRFEEFDRYIQQQATQATQQGRELSAEDYAKMRRQVFDELVKQRLMNGYFKTYQLQGSPEEVLDYLRRNPPPGAEKAPIFMGPDSQFSKERYEKWLADPRIYADPYMRMMEAEITSSSLPAEQLQAFLAASIYPTSLDLSFRTRREGTRGWGISLTSLDDSFRIQSAPEDEMRKYFEAHKDSFYFAKEAALVPVVSLVRGPSHTDSVRVREDADTLIARVQAGESFDTLAKDYSEDHGSAAKYGSLGGFQSRSSWVPAFSEAVAKLQPGQLSAPVQSQFGWHIIRLNALKLEGSDTLYDASHILLRITPSPETIESLKDSLEGIATKVKAGTSFADATKAAGLTIDTVRVVRGSIAETPKGNLTGLSAWAFRGQKEEKVSEVLDNDEALFLAGPATVKAPGPDFEASRGRLNFTVMSKLRREKAQAWFEKNAAAIEACKNDTACLNAIGKLDIAILENRPSETFLPGFRYSAPSFFQAWAQAAAKPKTWSSLQPTVFGVGRVWLDSVKVPTDAEVAASAKAEMVRKRAAEESQKSIAQWVSDRRKEVKIKDNLDRFYRD